MELTQGQLDFLKKFEPFLNNPSQRMYKLIGNPGTGKTFIVAEALKRFNLLASFNVGLYAPTNKATNNLVEMCESLESNIDASTLHKGLSLTMSTESPIMSLIDTGNEPAIRSVDIAIIDESSMVNKELVERIIQEMAYNPSLKILILGDRRQLAPINESRSLLLDMVTDESCISELTETKRFHEKSDIFPLVEQVQRIMDGSQEQLFSGLNFNRKNEFGELWMLPQQHFTTMIRKSFIPEVLNTNENRILTYRRNTFKEFNTIIRENLYGKAASHSRFIIGEHVISYSSARQKPKKYAKQFDVEGSIFIGDTGYIEEIQKCSRHPQVYASLDEHIPALNLSIRLNTKNRFSNYVRNIFVSPNEESDLLIENVQQRLQDEAEKAPDAQKRFKWAKYHEFKNMWFDIANVHAQTVHSSQGSSIEDVVFIPYYDLLVAYHQNPDTFYRLLYVATSRSKRKIVIGY
jgi:ATP-dependent exoDNAse (exonuclease V) alpha subunit